MRFTTAKLDYSPKDLYEKRSQYMYFCSKSKGKTVFSAVFPLLLKIFPSHRPLSCSDALHATA